MPATPIPPSPTARTSIAPSTHARPTPSQTLQNGPRFHPLTSSSHQKLSPAGPTSSLHTMPFQGLDPYSARQHLLHHTYLPLIAVLLSHSADVAVQTALGATEGSLLLVFKVYGNNAKYAIPSQTFKITNTQLITKTYPSFPVRFDNLLPDLLSILNASRERSDKLTQLFSILLLEALMRHVLAQTPAANPGPDLYLLLFNKIITSNNIVPFETFNHPISQIFVIDYAHDSVDSLRRLIVDFRNHSFPKYFQIDDLLVHVFVFFDPSLVLDGDINAFQNSLRKALSISSTCIPMLPALVTAGGSDDYVSLPKNELSTIEEDLQAITLNRSSGVENDAFLRVPKALDTVLRHKMYEYINKFLIPHMERKIRLWGDLVLGPKKSITGRFFSVSRKLFNNNSNPEVNNPHQNTLAFNYVDNHYHKSSPEQVIRKLADWSLILKDFKYAYNTYDLIKKDYTNDKAWIYVASTQEMCISSLLLAQTQQVGPLSAPPDKNTLRKIRHDIIEPYVDNLCYTFKSRLNVKTYSIKTLFIVVELLLCMCTAFNISWWWNDLIERYLCKCISEFDSHLLSSNQKSRVIRALLYERLGYSFGKCIYLNNDNQKFVDFSSNKPAVKEEVEEGFYQNSLKLMPDQNNSIKGLTRFRKSAMWYLLSIKEWLQLKNYSHIQYLLNNIVLSYEVKTLTSEWFDRPDLLLGFVKRALVENVDEAIE